MSDLSGTDSTLALAHDDQFLTMLVDYRCGGGLARAPEVFARFECCSGMDVGTLAGWIVNRRVICFEWQARMWLPLFQFNQPDMRPPAALRRVLEVLTPRMDAWALACWFGRPNPWLADQGPCDVLEQDPAAVLRAARGDDAPVGTQSDGAVRQHGQCSPAYRCSGDEHLVCSHAEQGPRVVSVSSWPESRCQRHGFSLQRTSP